MKLLWVMIALLAATLLVVRAHGLTSVSPSPTPPSTLPPPPLSFPPQNVDFKFPKLPKIHLPKFHLHPRLLHLGICIAECNDICEAGKTAILYRSCMAWCLPRYCRPSRLDVVNDCAFECMAAPTTSGGYDEIDDYTENCFKSCGEEN